MVDLTSLFRPYQLSRFHAAGTTRVVAMRLVLISFLCVLSLAVVGAQPSGLRIIPTAGTTTSIEQYGITWYFDSEVEYGQFVNGDYWVVGPVTITDIDPSFEDYGYGGRNGTMVNPEVGAQGYDAYRDPTYGTIGYRAELNLEADPGLPATIDVSSSVVSSIGRSGSGERLRPLLQTAAVLTVLSERPPEDAFRPPLIGSDKPIYRWADVDLASIPAFEPVSGVPSDISRHINNFQRPWILHRSGWQGRYLHPRNNMSDYHGDIGRELSAGGVLLLMNVDRRDELIQNYIQVGIDYYAMAANGSGTSAFWSWPVIFAGAMLGDSTMENMFINEQNQTIAREDDHLYRVATQQRSNVESDIVPAGKTWTGKDVAWRQDTSNSNCYEQEHLHPTEWSAVSSAYSCSQSLHTRETYRRINSPAMAGMALAAAVLEMQDKYLQPELFFAYAERWMEEDLSDSAHDVYGGNQYTSDNSEYGSTTSDFVDNFWEIHYPRN